LPSRAGSSAKHKAATATPWHAKPQIEIILMSPSPQNEGSDKLAGVTARRNNAKRLEGQII
jgi:hypothetical protein